MRSTVLALTLGLAALVPAFSGPAYATAPAKAPAAAAPKYDETKLKALEAKLAKSPKDAKLKSEVAEANYQVGYQMEYNSSLSPREKYRGALAKYRRALALNPKHAKAAKEKDQIEAIYKQMGMPVPK
jgi:hypothetical protein